MFFIFDGFAGCILVLTRVDYCNSVLACLPDSAVTPLQLVLHAVARFIQPCGHGTVHAVLSYIYLAKYNFIGLHGPCHSATDAPLTAGASAYYVLRITYMYRVAFGYAPTYSGMLVLGLGLATENQILGLGFGLVILVVYLFRREQTIIIHTIQK